MARQGKRADVLRRQQPPAGSATTGHEAALWAMADALRGSMAAAERLDPTRSLQIIVPPHAHRLSSACLCKHGYPPDKQESATRTVLEQAEVLSTGWATVSAAMETALNAGCSRTVSFASRALLELLTHWSLHDHP